MKQPLSKREREVLRLVQQGLANKVIGAELGIAESTVKVHVKKLMRHHGVSKRTQLVILGHKPDPRVDDLLEALRRIGNHCPLPSLVALQALHKFGDSP